MKSIGRFATLFACCFLAGVFVRWPGFAYPYFCWDEHDYIAHNIYARAVLGHFEIPYSNKWPLGHAIVYLLTRPWSPFLIAPYRIAMLAVDTASAVLASFCFTSASFRTKVIVSLLYLIVSSACLRISQGIIVENMANLPIIAAACILVRPSAVRWGLTMFFLSAACLIKPTAVFPGFGLICGQLWFQWKLREGGICRELVQITVWFFIFISIIVGLYWLSVWNARDYFWRSAVVYNALNNSILRSTSLGNYAAVFLTGFAFFQYLVPAVVLGAIAIRRSRIQELDQSTYQIVCIALAWGIGALTSLLVRPAGAQTSYWLYLLPPVFLLAISGYRLLYSRLQQEVSFAVAVIATAPFVYAWALFAYGQPKGLMFGSGGGVRVVQTQIEEILPTVQAVISHPSFKPEHSRLFLWDLQWQIFYFTKAVPAASILTNETWNYSIDRRWQEHDLREEVEASADFVVTGKSRPPPWLDEILARSFMKIYAGEHQDVYARRVSAGGNLKTHKQISSPA